jgi:hypothetical protein
MTATLSKTTVESKAVLARMLATENLAVEHNPQAETAYFDVENRKLVFPCWKGMTDHLYDMLTGHETAHALFTPSGAAALDEAIKKVDPRPEAAFAAKQYLNVVEDARIERLVKEKYPGLRRTFFLAYQDLVKSELMAPAVSRVHELKLIDRANLHYKVGTFVDVPFTEAELNLVERMEKTKTFDEVVELARLMWEYEKQESKKQEQEKSEKGKSKSKSSSSANGEEKSEGGDSKPSEEKTEEKSEESKPSNKSGDEESKEESAAESNSTKGTAGSEVTETEEMEGQSDPLPTGSETDGLLNEFSKSKKDKDPTYYKTCNLPKFRKEIGVIPASVVIPMLAECGEKNNGLKFYGEWKSRNAESVAVLCREFERRRAADTAARTSMSDSGALDVNRLWSYRVSDEIFAQYANVKTGQSHGLQVFVDFSGSMGGILYETICQMVSLAAFCRRMNVPFDVYAFTDGLPMRWTCPGLTERDYGKANTPEGIEKYAAFKCEEEGMRDTDTRFRLIQLLTTGMSERQFRMAVGGMLACVTRAVHPSGNPNTREACDLFRLNGTPTNKATLAAMDLVPEFRKRYNLQIVHAVFLTDGESGDRLNGPKSCEWPNDPGQTIAGYVLRDTVTGNTEKANSSYCSTAQNKALNRLLAKRVKGCNVIGISLCPTREFREKMVNGSAKRGKDGSFDSHIELAKKRGYCEAEDCYGYTRWFGMNAPHFDESDYFANIDSDAPKAVMTKAFAKTIKQGTMNRSLLARFVELISK